MPTFPIPSVLAALPGEKKPSHLLRRSQVGPVDRKIPPPCSSRDHGTRDWGTSLQHISMTYRSLPLLLSLVCTPTASFRMLPGNLLLSSQSRDERAAKRWGVQAVAPPWYLDRMLFCSAPVHICCSIQTSMEVHARCFLRRHILVC